MNLRQIEAFKAVMITGSATKAAESMYITQPAVSRLLADLEHSIDFKLFIRKPNRLMPTPEAKLLFQQVDRAFIGLDAIKRTAEGIAQKQTGHLRIVAMEFIIDSFLPKLIADFLKKYPHIAIELETAGRNTVVELIESHQFDLGLAGLAHLPSRRSSLFYRVLKNHHAVCILPKLHRLSEKNEINANDLRGERFIALSTSSPFRMYIDEVFEKAGIKREICIETRTQLAICNMVASGAGLSIVDPLIANSMRNQIVTRSFTPMISWNLALLAPPFKNMSLVAQSFSDWVYKQLST